MPVNREQKSSLFVALFNNETAIRELYGALRGKPCAPDMPITITTLRDVLYRGLKNDLSFVAEQRILVVTEHQSSACPNMPLRCMGYLDRLYQQIVDHQKLHKSKLVKIYRPKVLTLYNGKAKAPAFWTYKLSDSFMDNDADDGLFQSVVEIIVPVYNINPGFNNELLKASPILNSYMTYINKYREYEHDSRYPTKEQAILAAIDYCITQGHLPDFFSQNRMEVLNMSLLEWTMDDALQASWSEGAEAARRLMLDLLKQGYTPEQLEEMARNEDPALVPEWSVL